MNLLWKKSMQNLGWLSLAAVGVVLLIAGVSKKDRQECKEVKVEVTGVNRHIFIDEKEVLKILNANGDLIGEPLENINLKVLEKRLESDNWIKNAELFFDNNQVLEVKVEEREPLARIFTTHGSSYYIDSSCSRLPLSDKVSIRVPMFTNFPSEAKRFRWRDSVLMTSIKDIATFVQADSFWNAQVAQINITPNRTFEVVPTIGNHTVLLGKGIDIEKKFQRLYSFYKQVWTKVGLDKYSIIDVQYKGQVVATRRGAENTSVDSNKAKEAFIKLLDASKPDTIDEVTAKVKPVIEKAKENNRIKVTSSNELTKKIQAEIAKAEDKPKEEEHKTAKPAQQVQARQTDDKKPKAVMTKKSITTTNKQQSL